MDKKTDILIRIILILTIAIAVFFLAIKPMFFTKDYYFNTGSFSALEKLNSSEKDNEYDVAILGDSVEGIAAAIGAAQVGAKTLIIGLSDVGLYSAIQNTQNVNWQSDISSAGTAVSSELFKKIRYNSGEGTNIKNYSDTIKKLVEDQKLIHVIYGAKLKNADYKNNNIAQLVLMSEGIEKKITAKRYIDATKDGLLLQKCGVGFTSGYSQIGINNLYPPLKLNFTVSGVDFESIRKVITEQGVPLTRLLQDYYTSDNHITIQGFNISDQSNGNVVIEGITVMGIDYSNEKKMNEAYNMASAECKELYNFLRLNVEPFKNASGVTVASEFIRPSAYHFKGYYTLKLSDVLVSYDFSDRVSTVARPVEFTLEDKRTYVLCNPKLFYIPLRSMVPFGLENTLMVGDKIDVSPLVQPAISSYSSLITNGQSAGVIAAYSISKKMNFRQLALDYNRDAQIDIEKTLRETGIYMSDIDQQYSFTQNWSYSSLEKLVNLGLLAAGVTNDFKLDKKANCDDLAYIILTGASRMSPEAYNLSFDTLVRKYIVKEPLTKEKFAEMLFEIYGKKAETADKYAEACKIGLIDDTLQKSLKNNNTLLMPDVYYSACKVLEQITGKKL